MNLLGKYSYSRLLVLSLLCAVFIVYPNIACLPWELGFLDESQHFSHLMFFAFRYLFFAVLIWFLTWYNLHRIEAFPIKKRVIRTFLLLVAGYLIYVALSFILSKKADCFGSILIFQFFVMGIVTTFVGHVNLMYTEQLKKEKEIEQLKVENLKSRCDALTNQINPHFFFNSLNGLSALIRKKDDEKTQEYVNKLCDVFRYILQSEKKGLVNLEEELTFVEAFRYMMEVRFANKLSFNIDVDKEYMNLKIPVLSLLPLIDNIVMHNTIDSQHIMSVDIRMNEQTELVVSNPVYPKLTPSPTNGTGLRNLENRFSLLMNKKIRIENNGEMFRVYLPLK